MDHAHRLTNEQSGICKLLYKTLIATLSVTGAAVAAAALRSD
jgi:hypothetical protein